MSRPSHSRDLLILWLSFILVLVLQVSPWPKLFNWVPDSWLPLLLIYWVLEKPEGVNIGTGFCIGLLWDLELGSFLGVRALALSLLAYGVASQAALLRSMTLLQQAVLVTLLILATHGIIFCTEGMMATVSFSPPLLWSGLLNGLLWPVLCLLLRKIRGPWKIH